MAAPNTRRGWRPRRPSRYDDNAANREVIAQRDRIATWKAIQLLRALAGHEVTR
jgi:hypothetical protein